MAFAEGAKNTKVEQTETIIKREIHNPIFKDVIVDKPVIVERKVPVDVPVWKWS